MLFQYFKKFSINIFVFYFKALIISEDTFLMVKFFGEKYISI